MNHGQSPHTFGVVVDGQTIETPSIDADGPTTLEVPALAAGTYDALLHRARARPARHGRNPDGADGAHEAPPAASGAAGRRPRTPPMTAEEMAAGHEEGVQDFLAGKETDSYGNQPMEPEMDGGVKVYNFTVEEIQWEIAKGEFVDAMAFNGQVPGPEVRVNEGDRVRFVVQNQMTEPFVLHFHGLTVPNSEDGVPYVTQPPIMPGEYWTYEFTIKDPPGMYVYHSHFNSAEQVDKGLYGALIVEPKSGDWSRVYGADPDVEYTHVRRRRHARVQPERQVVPGDRSRSFAEGRLGPDPPCERRCAAAPDAPARLPLPGRGGGRVPAAPSRTGTWPTRS